MKLTGHAAVDEAPQVVAEWLNLLCDELDWGERVRAYRLLSETLHALRDYLGIDMAAALAAQLPLIIRGIYYTNWNPSETPTRGAQRGKDEFFERVSRAFTKDPLDDTERAVAAVFSVLRRKLSPGEIDRVRHVMRAPLADLW
ncbi:DUF2267 domain-containing protein [Poseidonocella sp. HB161398]|uniref:DUF2267 domain-containing protein n=1 Tax=Poseidonocella sp. HB161398 TaxID=2320855 RepID=UPI001108D027|nr:DUF2267 domain-containing protein [Poseidonocella sp. HB161398]